MDSDTRVLEHLVYRFSKIEELGRGALDQLRDADDWHARNDDTENSIALIVTHLHGNMMSRWTDFLMSDGEKEWRERDEEFEVGQRLDVDALRSRWQEGWACVQNALTSLTPDSLTAQVTIRGQQLDVVDALLRQISHYSYHVGQIVLLVKARLGSSWKTLSIAKGASQDYRPGSRRD